MAKLSSLEIIELKKFVRERTEAQRFTDKLEQESTRTSKSVACKKCGKIKVGNWVTAMIAGGENENGRYEGRCYCKNTK